MASLRLSLALLVATFAFAVQGGSRYRRDAGDDIAAGANQALEDTESFFKTIYGARCVQDDQCFAAPYISYCNKEAGAAASITGISGLGLDGVCQLTWYVWAVLAAISLLCLGACICCCLCSCCACLWDFLCCCCRGSVEPADPHRGRAN